MNNMTKMVLKRLVCFVIAYAIVILIVGTMALLLPDSVFVAVMLIALFASAYPRHDYYFAIMRPNDGNKDVMMLYKTYKSKDVCNKFIEAFPEYKLICCNKITKRIYNETAKIKTAIIIND